MSGLLRFATAGSVDDGKSTLVGRLLYDSKVVLADTLDALSKVSLERGFGGDAGGLDLALLTDGLRAEREQGITIDVAYRYFSTGTRNFILADCPGHVQYTKNTVTGASTADAAVVLIDARHGVVEQTRRHLAVLAVLRVPHVVLAVNKMDLVDFSQEVFIQIASEVAILAQSLELPDPVVIPVSALEGDNVVAASTRMDWYSGLTLLEVLEGLPLDDVTTMEEPLRIPVQYVIRPQGGLAPGLDSEQFRDYRGYAGQVASGRVALGQRLEVISTAGAVKTTTVMGIDGPGGEAWQQAETGDSVVLRLADEVDIARGDLLASGQAPVPQQEVDAIVAWLADTPLRTGQRVLVKHGTKTVQALVQDVSGQLELQSFQWEPPKDGGLALNDIGNVRLRLASSLPVEPYTNNRRAGAFLVIDPNSAKTLAAGMVRS